MAGTLGERRFAVNRAEPVVTAATNAKIDSEDDGARLDRWFRRYYPGLAHGELEKLLRTGQVRLDGKRAKAGDRISTGQIIRLPPQLSSMHRRGKDLPTSPQGSHPRHGRQDRISAEDLVIHKDSSVLVLNKPSGLATQGGSGIRDHVDGLLDRLAFERKQRPRLIHRLDRDTSGVLVVARTAPAAAALSESFRRRDASKTYWALTRGVPKQSRGTIRSSLSKTTAGRQEKIAEVAKDSEGARSAITEYAVIATAGKEFAWIAARPVTGRMHQIRVHLASLGTPVVGDFKYGGSNARGRGQIENRLHLHARAIDIAHPDGGRLKVMAPLPPHMLASWRLLGFDPDANSPFDAPNKTKRR